MSGLDDLVPFEIPYLVIAQTVIGLAVVIGVPAWYGLQYMTKQTQKGGD